MSSYALKVVSAQVRGDGGKIMTKAGEPYWVIEAEGGWVEASSACASGVPNPPLDAMIFKTIEAADAFADRWEGHPWWTVPIKGRHTVVEVTPIHAAPKVNGYVAIDKKRPA